MSQPRRKTGWILSLVFIFIICMGVCLAIGAYFELNRRTEAVFGPPTRDLTPFQRLRFSAQLLLSADQLLEPAGQLEDPIQFEIQLGESPLVVADRLHAVGLIPDSGAFVTYLSYTGLDRSVQAGTYSLNPTNSPIELAHILQDATPSEVTLSILPGWRLEEIAATLPTSGLEITEDEFLSTAYLPSMVMPDPLQFLQETSVEGFLPPGSYRLEREINTSQLFTFLLGEFVSNLSLELIDGFQLQGLNLHQAVTLASIVERESIVADEMPLIASVFLNRLAIGMPLEADSTVQYAVGFNQNQNTWWTNPLRERDLRHDSPYNTYLYPGLPPGPIANPSFSALRAVGFPAQTPYYYFRATCDDSGRHSFSETYEQHLSKGCP